LASWSQKSKKAIESTINRCIILPFDCKDNKNIDSTSPYSD